MILKKTNVTEFLGMFLKNIDEEEKEIFNLEKGVIIQDLRNNRLYRYGIDEGFVILEINKKKINEVADLESFDLQSLNSILFLKPNREKERIIFE